MSTRMYNQLGITAGYQEAAVRASMFTGANQGPGGTTTTVGLATTYTGLVLSNPANSGKNLALYEVNVAVVGAPVALSVIGLLGGYVAAGLVTHTTPLVVYSNILGIDGSLGSSGHAATVATVDAAATLPSTPVLLRAFATMPITGVTAQVVNAPVSGVTYNAEGNIIVEPGGFVAVYTSTVLTIIASMTWTELVP